MNKFEGSISLNLIRNNLINFSKNLRLFDQIEHKINEDQESIKKYANFIKEKEYWTNLFENQAETLIQH